MNPGRIALGFTAGFFAVPTFHQLALAVLYLAAVTSSAPWPTAPVPPLGVPAILSASFWGGVWGIVLMLVLPPRASTIRWLLAATLFGAIAPTLVAWFVVLPLKGLPAGGGFAWPRIVIGPIVNGAWGLGTGLLLLALPAFGPGSAARGSFE